MRRVYVDPALIEYAVRLVTATREPRLSASTASRTTCSTAPARAPRSTSSSRARARAFVRGRDYALPEDVHDLALDVMRHRLVLSYEALADGVTPDEICSTRSCSPSRTPRSRSMTAPAPSTPPRRDPAQAERLLQRLDWQVDPSARRAPAGRSPYAVLRLGHRLRRPARVPGAGRRALHRLERDRAPRRALRAPVHRRPRAHRLAAARPVVVDGLRSRRTHRRTTCSRSWPPRSVGCSRATATASARCCTTTPSSASSSRGAGAGRSCGSPVTCCASRPVRARSPI